MTFSARYDGHCTQCQDAFEEGDEIGYVDDEIACGSCVESTNDDSWFQP
jgi:hypothetical protein